MKSHIVVSENALALVKKISKDSGVKMYVIADKLIKAGAIHLEFIDDLEKENSKGQQK